MEGERQQLHVFFFPAMAHGHMIPMVDMARLFASRGVKATIVTTPLNAALISKSIQTTHHVHILTFKFPSAEAGLPDGIENIDSVPPHLLPAFFLSSLKMQVPLEQLLRHHRPDGLVADFFFPWATDLAHRYNIPRFVFHGTSFFSLCVATCTQLYQPFKNVTSDSEPILIPNLPDRIEMTRSQFPDRKGDDDDSDMGKLLKSARESDLNSDGIIVNSFYELEHAYADLYRIELGRKAWHVGPLSLCNWDAVEKTQRGKEASMDENECLKWLDSKKAHSVVYICFGSAAKFNVSQLREIAYALEASEHPFIWVVRNNQTSAGEQEEWLPEGFEKRMEGKGLIIRGWAPQVLILENKAIGAFVTHCGWNSTIEAITAGVPMVTWPLAAEQFSNEKLVTQILRIGVGVGVKKWVIHTGDGVNSDAIEKAVNKVMAGEEAEEMRNRAKNLSEKSKLAMEEGGSSVYDLEALIRVIALNRREC